MRIFNKLHYTIRFRQWSRKAYAAFCSLGRNVTIGTLRKSVIEASLSKVKSGTSSIASIFITEKDSSWEKDSLDTESGCTDILITDILITLQQEKSAVANSHALIFLVI